ncbi:MAG: PAS domain S-box protein [Thermodesulfobacteriota bacterium]|nr:PAS domain S-box protein [Thermodesulfobacteriota bacterium]
MQNSIKFKFGKIISPFIFIILMAGFAYSADSAVKIGVLAKRGAERCLEKWSPTAEYLTKNIPGKNFVIVPLDYDQIYTVVKNGEVDFILANSSFYVELESWFRVSRIATLKNKRVDGVYTKYGGIIFCKKNREDIRRLSDLKGKTFMAVKTSFGGWRMAWREFKDAGINPFSDFSSISFGGTHDAVVYAVRDEKVDAGTVRTDTFERMQNEGRISLDDFHVIHEHGGGSVHLPFLHSTREYPEWPIAKLKHISNEIAEKVAIALIAMPADSAAANASRAAGWTIPLNYQPVHECLKELKLGPYKDLGKITVSAVVKKYWILLLIVAVLFAAVSGTAIFILRFNRNIKENQIELQTEVEERKRAEAALRKSERDARQYFDVASVGFVALDKEGNITLINKRGLEILGYRQEELIGRNWFKTCLPDKLRKDVLDVFHQMIRGEIEPVKYYENLVVTKEGEERILFWHNAVLRNPGGEITGVLSSGEDITERKKAKNELKKRSKLEYLINKVSVEMLDADIDTFDAAIQNSLDMIGISTGIDRNYIFLFSEDLTTMSNVYEWCIPGIEPQKGDLQNLSSDTFPWWMKKLKSKEYVYIPVVNDMPGEANLEKEILQMQDIKSLLVVPMFNKGKLIGFAGYDSVRKFTEWTEDEIGLLQTLSDIFTSALIRKQTQSVLMKSEKRFKDLFNSITDLVYTQDIKGRIISVNPAMQKAFEYEDKELIGHKAADFMKPELVPFFESEYFEKLKTQGYHEGITVYFKKNGEKVYIEYRASMVNPDDGEPYISGTGRDVTDKILSKRNISKLQKQLAQAQKMESIGTLAGGIAHDFNNILFPVFGYLEMMLLDIPEDSPLRGQLEEIFNGAKRARDLVQQILRFSRQSGHEMKPLKVHLVIKEALKLIKSSLPSTIEISQNIKTDCRLVMADSTQLHQVIMNLCTNAFHAMEKTGGKLIVNLKEVELAIEDLKDQAMIPGKYICLTVADTGTGMDQGVIDRIFDPYYTTKEEGKGTGLGLAVAHGIVKSHGGHISVYSEPGKGSEFQILLPVIEKQKESAKVETDTSIQKGDERILLVDDEDIIVQMEKQMLERLGYHVTVRTSSADALEAFKANPDRFDLIITDMTMPNMTGDKLAGEIMKIRLDIPVILCTGFSERMSDERAESLGIKGFLMKPVVMKDLSNMIRKVLGKEFVG